MNSGRPSFSIALTRIFPSGIAAFELRGAGSPRDLRIEETPYSATFAPGRKAEFAAGRSCAHAALAALGLRDDAIVVNADRSPAWPPGAVGSISHTDGYCAAVVGPATRFVGIGLDVEREGRVTADLCPLVFTSEERAGLDDTGADLRARAATIAFCAKEAYYKCQYAVTKSWVDFHDVAVTMDLATPVGGSFEIRAKGNNPAARMTLPLSGLFSVDGDLVSAAVAIVR